MIQVPVEGFRLCPVPGCTISVWGPTNSENHCRAHGGNRLGFPEIEGDDEWGNPIHPHAENAAGPSSPAAFLPPSECE